MTASQNSMVQLENRRIALAHAAGITNRDDVTRLAREFAAFLDGEPGPAAARMPTAAELLDGWRGDQR